MRIQTDDDAKRLPYVLPMIGDHPVPPKRVEHYVAVFLLTPLLGWIAWKTMPGIPLKLLSLPVIAVAVWFLSSWSMRLLDPDRGIAHHLSVVAAEVSAPRPDRRLRVTSRRLNPNTFMEPR